MAVDTKELRALLAKMTPGKWVAAPYSSMVGAPIVASPSGRPVAKVTYFHLGPEFDNHNRESAANAAGIVALVNAAPALLASAARAAELEQEVSRLRHTATDMVQHVEWLTSGLPALLENDGLTDEEGLIGAATDAAKSARAALGDQP